MQRQLSLIKNNLGNHEKRLLPRFPYSAMTFRLVSSGQHKDEKTSSHVFEIKDITYSGMQLALKGIPIPCEKKEIIEGHIHWHGEDLPLEAVVEWATKDRMGVSFYAQESLHEQILNFLSPQKIATHLRPLHKMDLLIDLPAQLKHWLHADGPHDIFMWCHPDGEFSKIQCIVREHFWEWEDGPGSKTGRVFSKRDLDTPLMSEDEFVFLMDTEFNQERFEIVHELVQSLKEEQLPNSSLDFLKRLT